MPTPLKIVTGVVLSSFVALALHAADKKDDPIKQIMKKYHKGDDSFVKKIGKGEATNDEVKKLLADYKIMAKEKPEKGDAASWKEKTSVLIAATEKLSQNAKDPAAMAAFKKAVNCKACHEVHKGD